MLLCNSTLAAGLGLVLLTGCGGEDDRLQSCKPFPPGSTAIARPEPSCSSCFVFGESDAIDRNADTFAQIGWGSGMPVNNVALEARAPAGIAYPQGGRAGVLIGSGGVATGVSLTVTTLLGSSTQESVVLASDQNIPTFSSYLSFVTTKPYDGVKVTVSQSDSDGRFSATIFEVCGAGG